MAPVVAQASPGLLARRAYLEVENVTLRVAIQALHQSSGIRVAFSPDLLPAGRSVTCHCRDLTVGQALDSILSGTGLRATEGRRQIIIGPVGNGDGPDTSGEGTLTGTVVEVGRSLPVPGADVRLLPGHQASSTGRDGRFRFRTVDGEKGELRVSALGYREIAVPYALDADGPTEVWIGLDLDPIPLAEVAISPGRIGALEAYPTAMGSQVSREEIEAVPQLGNDPFRTLKRMPGIALTRSYMSRPRSANARRICSTAAAPLVRASTMAA